MSNVDLARAAPGGRRDRSLSSTRRHASFGTRIWAQPARFALAELEYAMVCLHRDFEQLTKTESVTSLRFDIEVNTVVVGASEDIAGLQTRLRQRFGDMITTELRFGDVTT